MEDFLSVNPALYAKLKAQLDPATPRVLTEREKMLAARRARQNATDARAAKRHEYRAAALALGLSAKDAEIAMVKATS